MFGRSNKMAPILVVTVLSVVLSLLAPAVGPGLAAAPPAQKTAVKMALMMIGEITDLSWNAQMLKAAQEVTTAQGIEFAYSEQVPEADAERVLREYADEGYNLIIAHSFSFGDAVFRVAPDYPEVNFAWPGGINKTAQNVADYDQPFYQATYLIGILVGSMSKTGVLGTLGGFDIPVCHSMAEGFLLGAQRMNPNVKMLSSYVGDWNDVAKAKEAALAQIEAGADISMGCGVPVGTIEAAKDKGTLAVGYVGDMKELAPDNVVVSMVWKLNSLVESFIKETEDGTFQPGKFVSYGVAKDGFDIAINPAFTDKIPKASADEMAKVEQEMRAGTFEAPYVPTAEAAAPPTPNPDFKLALLTIGQVADGGWNATAYKGLQMVKDKYGITTALSEDVKVPDIEAVMRDYCSQGYNLIIGHSFPFGDPAIKVAPDFPDCKFAITTAAVSAPNVASYYPMEVESNYLSGVLAALMSKSKKIGVIGGMELPNLVAKVKAVEEGAKATDPNIQVTATYVGNFDDPAKGKELALAQIADGADVIIHMAATSGLGVIEAAVEKNVWVTSDVVLNQELAPDNMIASTVQDYPGMVEYWYLQVLTGQFKGEVYRPGLSTGLLDLALTKNVPEDVAKKIAEVKQQIVDGKIKVEEKFE